MNPIPGSALMAAPQWIARRGRWARGGLGVLAGAAMTMGHAPVNLPWLFFLAVPLLIWLLDAAPGARAAFWTGWCAGFGYFVTGLHWIGHAFLIDADQFLWLLPFAVTLLPAGLGFFWGLAAVLARQLIWGPLRVAGFAAMLTLAEYARGHLLTGFPWALPGYVWVETPMMQAASWAGPYGMTFLTLLLTGLPLVALAGVRHRFWPAAGSVLAVAALWAAGALRIPAETAYAADAPMLRVVQPNATQALKRTEAVRFYRRLLDLSAAPDDVPPDIVIWPESAVEFLPAYEPEERARIGGSGGGAVMLLGANHGERIGGRDVYYNSLFALAPDGTILARYDKHHLVPFGEYLPLQGVLRAIGLTELASQRGGFSTGPAPQLLELPGLPGFTPLICYELIFPDEVIPEAGRPDWILQVTNDAWFGNLAGPQQHLAQAQIRAIEFGLPVVRAANTGISAIIDPYGRLIATLGLDSIGYIGERLPAKIPTTTYSRTRDIPALSLSVIVVLLSFYSEKRRSNR